MIKVIIGILVTIAIVCIGLIVYMLISRTKPTTKYDLAKRKIMNHYNKINMSAKHHQVVMVGDSIIHLYDTDVRYRDYGIEVQNRGISGDTSDRMLGRLYANALSLEPKTLFILVGTNDIEKRINEDVIIANIKEAIHRAKESKVETIYLESLYPVNSTKNKILVGIRTNEVIRDINAKLQKLCIDEGISYINVHDSLTDENGDFDKDLTLDGLHPNQKGYDIVTDIIKDYIK